MTCTSPHYNRIVYIIISGLSVCIPLRTPIFHRRSFIILSNGAICFLPIRHSVVIRYCIIVFVSRLQLYALKPLYSRTDARINRNYRFGLSFKHLCTITRFGQFYPVTNVQTSIQIQQYTLGLLLLQSKTPSNSKRHFSVTKPTKHIHFRILVFNLFII